LKLTPNGSAPDWDRAGAGKPPAVTVNEPAAPTMKLALFGLVMEGGPGVCAGVGVAKHNPKIIEQRKPIYKGEVERVRRVHKRHVFRHRSIDRVKENKERKCPLNEQNPAPIDERHLKFQPEARLREKLNF
jgi:hypothetical protein